MNSHASARRIYLRPGEVIFAHSPAVISTILGSCVAVTLFCTVSGVAAVCHAMLPSSAGQSSWRYVDNAVPSMIDSFRLQRGTSPQLVAKLFGGAELFVRRGEVVTSSVGALNIDMARTCLRHEGIELSAVDIGGGCGRKMLFHTGTGDVFIKKTRILDSGLKAHGDTPPIVQSAANNKEREAV